MYLNNLKANIDNEIDQLNNIATDIGMNAAVIKDWNKKIQDSVISYNTDKFIHQFEIQIRNKIIQKSIKNSKFWGYKSIDNDSYELNMSADTNYTRSLPLDKIEKQFKNSELMENCICFNSGMSALNAVITICQKIISVPVYTYSAYFETYSLLKEITIKNKMFENKDAYLNTFSGSNLHLVEMPVCSTEIQDLSIDEIKNGILNSKKKVFILIIDSTLELENKKKIKSLLNINKNLIVFKVRSGLKLDQFGLELANLGIVEVYSNLSGKHIEFIVNMLKNYRAVSGLSIDYNSYLRLVSPILTAEDKVLYKQEIKRNTSKLFEIISKKENKYFKVKFKSGLPFIFLTPIYPNFKLVKWVDDLVKEVNDKGGYLPYGTSFGFRHTRLEIIDDRKKPPYIRLSPGAFLGKSNNILLQYLENKSCEKYAK